MSVFVVFLVISSYLLAWIAGESMHPVLWALIVYPMVRYAIYSAISMAFATLMHPLLALCAVLVISVLTTLAAPSSRQLSTRSAANGNVRDPSIDWPILRSKISGDFERVAPSDPVDYARYGAGVRTGLRVGVVLVRSVVVSTARIDESVAGVAD